MYPTHLYDRDKLKIYETDFYTEIDSQGKSRIMLLGIIRLGFVLIG